MLLALETATDVCSVALLQEGSVTAVAEVLRPRSHAEQLAPLVQDVLARQQIAPRDLAAVAVSAGPGSYTGLRIGVSTAKGLCFAAGAGLVAVSSLEALVWTAADVAAPGDLILAALPSRRGEIYTAAYEAEGNGLRLQADPAALPLSQVDSWLPEAAGTLWLLGDGAAQITRIITRPHRLLDPLRHRPTAVAVAHLGWKKWASGTEEDLAAFEPFYLKPFEVRRGAPIFDRLSH